MSSAKVELGGRDLSSGRVRTRTCNCTDPSSRRPTHHPHLPDMWPTSKWPKQFPEFFSANEVQRLEWAESLRNGSSCCIFPVFIFVPWIAGGGLLVTCLRLPATATHHISEVLSAHTGLNWKSESTLDWQGYACVWQRAWIGLSGSLSRIPAAKLAFSP